jgi:hypothetical protein
MRDATFELKINVTKFLQTHSQAILEKIRYLKSPVSFSSRNGAISEIMTCANAVRLGLRSRWDVLHTRGGSGLIIASLVKTHPIKLSKKLSTTFKTIYRSLTKCR